MKMKHLFIIAACCWNVLALAQNGEYKKAFKSGDPYEYNCTGKDVSLTYMIPFYTDSPFFTEEDWNRGSGPLGYGTTGIKTQSCYGDDPENKVITTYLITDEMSFDFNGIEFDSLILKVRYNDGFIAYINGVEVARRNILLPGNTATATAEHSGEEYELINITPFKASILTAGSFFAAEVHQNAANSSDLVFDFEMIYYKSQSPIHQVTRKPYLMLGTPTSVEIRYQTSTPSATNISYGETLALSDHSYTDTNKVTEHKAIITGLTPDTKYYYTLNGESTFTNEPENQFFHSNPVAGTVRPYRFWVLGDFGDGSPNQLAVLTNYTLNNVGKFTDAWLWLGDNVYSTGTQGEYQTKMFTIYPTVFRNTMTYPSPGNHDLGSANALEQEGAYFDNFDVPCRGEAGGVPSNTEAYYSYDYGNIHFISLESTQTPRKTNGEMAQWLKKDLMANKQQWAIAYWHHPPYTKGSHNSDNEGNLIEMRQYIVPILEQYGVDLVMTGHSHTYERSYLIDSHYGLGATIADSNFVQGKTDGRMDGDGPYLKPAEANYSHKGTVYFVNGTGGSLSTGEEIDHPAHYKAIEEGGSVILEINGDTLTSTFMNAMNATNDDQFTIIKSKSEPCSINFTLGDDQVLSNGDSIVLNATNRFLKYEWSTGSDAETQTIKTAGQYFCKVYSSASCFAVDTVNIYLNEDAAVDLGPDTLLCAGQELILSVPNVFKKITWSNGQTTPSIVVNQQGIYSVTVEAANGSTASDIISVLYREYPVVSIATSALTVKENENVSFFANGVADDYTWDFADFATATGNVATHAFEVAGIYNVKLAAFNNHCKTETSRAITVIQDTTGNGIDVQISDNMGLVVYPNPAEEVVNIKLDQSIRAEVSVDIYDNAGRLVFSKTFKSSDEQLSIDVDSWAHGLYHLQVSSKTSQFKVAKSKFVVGKK